MTETPKAERKTSQIVGTLVEFLAWAAVIVIVVFTINDTDWQHHADAKRIGLALVILVSVMGLLSCARDLTQEQMRPSLWREIRRVALTALGAIGVLMILVITKSMVDSSSLAQLWEPKFEWIVAAGIALGVLGAAWAVLAKLEASRAFSEAFESKRYALRTYNSIAGAFRFNEILKPNTDSMLPFHVGRAHSELILFLGFPAVGFFHQGKASTQSFLEAALTFGRDLANRLEKFAQDTRDPLVRLVLFSHELTQHYLDKGIADKTITPEQRQDYEAVEARLYSTIAPLLRKNTNFKCAVLEQEIGLRFAISKSIDPDEEENERAIVWVVADFLPNDGTTTPILSDFGSAGFKSRDPEVIRALRSLCDDYVEHPRPGLVRPFLPPTIPPGSPPAPTTPLTPPKPAPGAASQGPTQTPPPSLAAGSAPIVKSAGELSPQSDATLAQAPASEVVTNPPPSIDPNGEKGPRQQ
jgi:hypothetical protein